MRNTSWRRHEQRLKLTALTIAATLALAGCAGQTTDVSPKDSNGADGLEQMDPVKLRVPTLYGPDHFQTKAFAAYADAVEEASSGKLSFEFFYGDALVKPADTVGALRDGVVDIALTFSGYTPSDFPVDQWTADFSAQASKKPVVSSLQSTAAIMDWAMNDDEQLAEYDRLGIVPLVPRFFGHDSYHLLCKDPVTDLASAKGKRVRVGGTVWQEEIASFGMTGVALSGAEIYEGFQRGIIDCYAGSAPDMQGTGLDKVGKHYTDIGMSGASGLGVMASKATWERLPLAAQQVLWDELPTFLEVWHGGYISLMHKWFANGITFHRADQELLNALQSHQENKLVNAVTDAPSQVANPKDSVDRLQLAFAEWLPIISDELAYDAGYESWAEWANETDGKVDLTAWTNALTQKILAPHRPK